ncbi:MAG: helix-turn-helix domain-containing protein [Prevotella sp.]
MSISNKERDIKAILTYLESVGKEANVDDIVKNSGAEKSKVYTILSELEHRGVIRRTKTTMWGTINGVKLI